MKERLIKKFEDELQKLNHELKLELPKEIKRARELGDLRENAEYQAAKERQRLVESQISMLQKRVAEISLINVDRIPKDRAGFGSTLEVVEGNGEKMTFQLVMPEDADAEKGMISTTSPIGRALINKEPGDTVKVVDPGRRARVRDPEADDDPRRRHRLMERAGRPPLPRRPNPYSPQRRTALVLTGTGTAGAYHAGVLRALHEAGVKLDIVAGRGAGVIGALFAAVDGAQRLWDDKGFWRVEGIEHLYEWRLVPRLIVWALGVSLAVVAIPIAAVALGADRVSDRLRPEDGWRQRRRRVGRGLSAVRRRCVCAGDAADLAAEDRAAGARRRRVRRPGGRVARGPPRTTVARRLLVARSARADVVEPCHRPLLAGHVGSGPRRDAIEGPDAG